MKCIANRTRHLLIACKLCNLSICCNLSSRNLLNSFVYPLSRTVRYKVITFRNHASDIFIRNSSIKNNSIPMFLILMITSLYRFIGTSPKITPLRICFYIQINITVSFINP